MNTKPVRNSSLLLGLCILLFPILLGPAQAASVDPGSIALVRIEAGSEGRLGDLAALDLTLYERLYTGQGDLVLVAAADQEARAAVDRLGFKLSVLDPHAQGASYTLLYGSPGQLAQARGLTRVLLVEGRQAVARTSPDQLGALVALGLRLAPLAPRPLIASPLPAERVAALPSVISTDPLIAEMIGKVSAADLYNLVGGLSGEWPVVVNGAPYTIATRYTYSGVPIKKATRYAHDLLQSFGLDTFYHDYPLSGTDQRNVIAQQTGLTQPDRIILLTAHLDSTSYVNGNPNNFAPGADDNGSGSAALLHIAAILSRYDFGCTLRYGLFTGEEQGLYGSKAYSAVVAALDDNIQAVLNLDMLAYNTPGSAPQIELHTRPSRAVDLAIAGLFQDVVNAYALPLTPLILQDGETFSDHSSFWDHGYPAILAIEDWDDHTPFYHQTGDQLETLDFTYYTPFVQASLATFAHMGCLLEGRLAGQVLDDLTGDPIPGATVEAWQAGAWVRSATTGSDGAYLLPLQPGSYLVKVSAQDHLGASYEDTSILNDQTTTLDAFLTPCAFVKDASISASSGTPDVDQTVFFTATVSGGDPPISFAWDFGDGATASGSSASHAFTNPGAYLVKLEADNACQAPDTDAKSIFVDVDLVFLPLTLHSAGQ